MDENAVWSTFTAQAGREAEVEAFLADCAAALAHEPGTTSFVAVRLAPGRFATFATMRDAAALAAHVGGPTADAVRARSAELFAAPPDIVQGSPIAVMRGADAEARRS